MSSPNPKLKLSDYVVVHLPDGLSQCQINDVRCAGLTTDIPLPFFRMRARHSVKLTIIASAKSSSALNNALSSTWKSSHGD